MDPTFLPCRLRCFSPTSRTCSSPNSLYVGEDDRDRRAITPLEVDMGTTGNAVSAIPNSECMAAQVTAAGSRWAGL